jgi:hypothetical protein
MNDILKFARSTVGAPVTYPRLQHVGAGGGFTADVRTPFGILTILKMEDGSAVLTETRPDPQRSHTMVGPRPIGLKAKYRK